MNTLGYICDWGLRRLFKLFLKRHLSNLLATEVDVEQLNVQLETGSLELKECLLDVKYLNDNFLTEHPVKVEAALIGSLRATLYPPTISIEDIALDLALDNTLDTDGGGKTAGKSHLTYSPYISSPHEKQTDCGRASPLEEGVQLITERLKSLMHQVQVDVKSCIIRVKSHDGCKFLANLGSLRVEDDCHESISEEDSTFARKCLFGNFALQFYEEDMQEQPITILSSTRGGCNGQLAFSWSAEDANKHCTLELAILNDISLWVNYPAIRAVRNAVQHVTAGYCRGHDEVLPYASQSTFSSQLNRARSILDALMLPNGEEILKEASKQSLSTKTANCLDTDEVEEFFDAVSEQMSQSWASAASVLVSSIIAENEPKEQRVDDVITQTSIAFKCELPNCNLVIDLDDTALVDPLLLRLEAEMITVSKTIGTRHVAVGCKRMEVFELGIKSNLPEYHRNLQQCVAVSSLFDGNGSSLLSNRNALSSTINRLYQLKVGTSVQAQEYEIFPLITTACADGEVAVSMKYSLEQTTGNLKVDLQLSSAHVWVDQQVVEKIANHVQLFKNLFENASASPSNKLFSLVTNLSCITIYLFLPHTKDIVALRMEGEEVDSFPSGFQRVTPDQQPFLDIVRNDEQVLAHINPTSLELSYCACSGYNLESYHPHRCVWGYDLAITNTISDSLGDVTIGSSNSSQRMLSIDVNGSLTLSYSDVISINTSQTSKDQKVHVMQDGRAWSLEARVRELIVHLSADIDETPYSLSTTNFVFRQETNQNWESLLTLCCQKWNMTTDDGHVRLVSGGSLNETDVEDDFSMMFSKRVSGADTELTEYNLRIKDLYFSDDWQKLESLVSFFKGFRGDDKASDTARSNKFYFEASNVLALYWPENDNLPHFGSVIRHFHMTYDLGKITTIGKDVVVFLKSHGDEVSLPSSTNFVDWLLSENFARVLVENSLEISFVPERPISVFAGACTVEINREIILELYALADAWHAKTPSQAEDEQSAFSFATDAQHRTVSLSKTARTDDDNVRVIPEIEGYTKNRAVVSGDGTWIPDVARLADVLENENKHVTVSAEDEWLQGYRLNWTGLDADLWRQRCNLKFSKIMVVLTGTTSFVGMEMLEGAVEAVLSDISIAILDGQGANVAAKRCVASLGKCKVRHCVQPQRIASVPWQEVMNIPSRGEQLTAARCIIEVSSGAQKSVEITLRLSLAPIKLVLHFFWLVFLSHLLSGGDNDPWQVVEESNCIEEDDWNLISSMMSIKKCHVVGFPCDLYFKRNSLSVGALKRGSLLELLNMLPEWKANLWLREMKIHEAEDVFRLGMLTAAGWIEDIIKAQMNRMLIRLPAVASFRRIGFAARDILQFPEKSGRKELKAYLKQGISYLVQTLSDESVAVRSR